MNRYPNIFKDKYKAFWLGFTGLIIIISICILTSLSLHGPPSNYPLFTGLNFYFVIGSFFVLLFASTLLIQQSINNGNNLSLVKKQPSKEIVKISTEDSKLFEILQSIEVSKERIEDHIQKINLRRGFNLAIGLISAFSGIVLLYIFINSWGEITPYQGRLEALSNSVHDFISRGGQEEKYTELVNELKEFNQIDYYRTTSYHLYRLTIVIIIQIIAFFFLRIYKRDANESKYFHNELSNIEAKSSAVRIAYLSEKKELFQDLVLQIAQTERNFILEKGQTTSGRSIKEENSESGKDVSKLIEKIYDAVKHG